MFLKGSMRLPIPHKDLYFCDLRDFYNCSTEKVRRKEFEVFCLANACHYIQCAFYAFLRSEG